MPSWLGKDHSQGAPTLGEIVESGKRLRFEPRPVPASSAIQRVLGQFADMMTNGAVAAAQLAVRDDDATAAWFLGRRNFNIYGFIKLLLDSAGVAAAMPEVVQGVRPDAWKGFDEIGSVFFDGFVASRLGFGGAYGRFSGTVADAKQLSLEFCHELFGDRWEDIRVDAADRGWSNWFHDLAWDTTWIITDLGERAVTLIALTDSD